MTRAPCKEPTKKPPPPAATQTERLAERQQAPLTRKRSLVRAQYRPPLGALVSGLVALLAPIRAQLEPIPLLGKCG